MDYGFDYVDRKGKNLESVFNGCLTMCHEIRRDRFYFCIMARSMSENGEKFNLTGKDDYFKLPGLTQISQKERIEFFEYTMGYSEKGYLDMCNYCNGVDSYLHPIPSAEQMEN